MSSDEAVTVLTRLFQVSDLNRRSSTKAKQTPLMLASLSGCHQVIELLLRQNANVNLQDQTGNTAIMFAVENDREEAVRVLLNCPGINLNLHDEVSPSLTVVIMMIWMLLLLMMMTNVLYSKAAVLLRNNSSVKCLV